MPVFMANEIWQELKRYVNTVDRSEAAETLVSVLIDNDVTAEEIKDTFKGDIEVKTALKQYLDDHADEEDDEEDDYDDYDANYPACTLCSCRIGDEVPYGADGIAPGEVYCERCAEWSGLI